MHWAYGYYGGDKNAYVNLAGKPLGKHSLGRQKRWEANIKVVSGVGCVFGGEWY